MLANVQRQLFSNIRADYQVSGRITALHGMQITAAINLGYAIESYLKQGLLETGFANKKIQYSHDLELLLSTCVENGIYNNISTSSQFIEFANGLFQMRYPISTLEQVKIATDKGYVIATDRRFLIPYDDLLTQLDIALWDFTNDSSTSSNLIICRGADIIRNQIYIFQNLYLLKNLGIYIENIKQYSQLNIEAVKALENLDLFWNSDDIKKIIQDKIFYDPYTESLEKNPDAAQSFDFPGKIMRDEDGIVIGFEV